MMAGPRLFRLNNFIDVSQFGSLVRAGKFLMVFGHKLLSRLLGIFCSFEFVSEDDIDCSLCSHHCNFGGGVTVIDISPDVLARHHVVRSAVGVGSRTFPGRRVHVDPPLFERPARRLAIVRAERLERIEIYVPGLVEGVPGLAKTMAIKTLAEAIGGDRSTTPG
jgi:hypothetical protein